MAGQLPPEFHEQVQLDNTVGHAPFETTYANAALNPTALGEFGSRIAIAASAARAQKSGLEAGMNPGGTLLPPITSADKAFQDAYISQAQNTLGLRANKLMIDGQTELSKSWKLTPELIATYTKNMSEGLNGIIDTAPMQAQPGLQAQFASSLMRTTGEYNQKMIGQQKQQATENANLFNTTQNASMYDAARAGQSGAAEKIYESTLQRNKQMLASGMISPLEADANEKAAKISLYSGKYTAEALAAFRNKRSDEYLAHLIDNKPAGMHVQEWESIAKNVLSEVQTTEAFKDRNESSLYSEANRMLQEGTLNSGFLTQLEAQTTNKAKFNNFMASVASFQRGQAKDTSAVDQLSAEWTNPLAMAVAGDKVKNKALLSVAQAVKQRAATNGRDISDFDAQTEAMSTVGTPVPAYTKQLNAGFLSGNPALMMRSLQSYQALNKSNPKVLNNMDKTAEAMMTAFEGQLENGNAPDVAAAKAQETVLKKTPEQLEVNNKIISDWESKTVNTPSSLMSWSKQFTDIGDGIPINNLPYFAQHVKNIFKNNMNYLNGDIEGAKKMTSEGIARAWGTTIVNGNPEYVFQPVEKTVGLDAGAAPLIKLDIYNQLREQIEPMDNMYARSEKNGDQRMSFHYRLPERQAYDDYAAAKEYLAKNQESFSFATPIDKKPTGAEADKHKKIAEAHDVIKQFDTEPLVIEKVYKSGKVEKFTVAVSANPGLQVDANGNLGAYNLMLKQNNGPSFPMNGFFAGPNSEPIYKPNSEKIRNRYFEIVGLNPTGKTAKETYQAWKDLKETKDKYSNPAENKVSRLGRFMP